MNKRGKSWVQAYKQVEEKFNKLFDIFCHSELSRKCIKEQYGISMLNEDYRFLESMRTDKKALCEGKVDTKYHIAMAELSGHGFSYREMQIAILCNCWEYIVWYKVEAAKRIGQRSLRYR